MPSPVRPLNGVYAYRFLAAPMALAQTRLPGNPGPEPASVTALPDALPPAGSESNPSGLHVGNHPIGIHSVMAESTHALHPRHRGESGHSNQHETARP